ncbi:putative mannosyltransferase OCH1-like protein [Port-miou virus]|uniref:Putative mannosyltransferase OCH1-like protein n=1 Tax=Port-miou virus TaxID=1733873 RepID=A0A0N9PHJ3_9VIRU|nr:putative mannosyltransferase OCH1-like protein [Port-miou virus]
MKKHQHFLEEIPAFIEKAQRTGKVMKKRCRNSYERRVLHQAAFIAGLSHRSIIDHTELYKNHPEVWTVSDSHCCPDCDEKEIHMTWTPHSWVEVNNGYEKQVIGTEEEHKQIIRNVYHLNKNMFN